jgi:hypothetical protein
MKENKKKTKKSSPTGVRFDLKLMESVKKDQGLATAQQVLTFYEDYYRQVKYPIQINPVMERNSPVTVTLPKVGMAGREITVVNRNPTTSISVEHKIKAANKPGGDVRDQGFLIVKNPEDAEALNLHPRNADFEENVAKRIEQLEKELKDGPPKDASTLAKKAYIFDRKKELESLKNQ